MLQMLSLILINSLFTCISVIFLNKISVKIKTFSNFFKFFHPSGICLEPFHCRLSDMDFHFYERAYDMFHIYEIFHQMISLSDKILQRESNISKLK